MPQITAAMVAHGRTVAEPRLSSDGSCLGFLATSEGRGSLVVADAGGGAERVVSTDPAPLASRAYGGGAWDWVPGGRALVYAGSDGGLWVQPSDGAPPRLLARHGDDPVAAPAVSPDGARVAYVVDAHHVAVVGLAEGAPWPVRLSGPADFCFDPAWSSDGEWVTWHEWDVPAMPWDESRVAARRMPVEGNDGPLAVAGAPGSAVQQPRFAPDGSLLAYLSDAEGWLNLWAVSSSLDDHRPLVKEGVEHGGATWGQGTRSFAWSPDGRSVAFTRNEDGFGSLHLAEVASGHTRLVDKGVYGGLSWAGGRLAAVRSGARTPTQVIVHEGPDLSARRTVAFGPSAGVAAADLVEPEVVHWAGEDGAEVPGRLYRPGHRHQDQGGPPPLIAWVHGGPTDQWPVSFQPRIAYWVDRGWAVLVADHRGSTGHGRAFAQALAGRWGELDSADVAAGLRAAAEQGWGHRRRLVVMGGSAGGMTVLNVLASHPGLCAAGVELYGVADLFELDETTHRFEAHYLHSLVGPLPEAADRYRDRSPLNRADTIVDPLLILQGSADEVVPPAQSRAIAERLRALGRTVELHEYEGEGHGWGRPETVIDELTRTESFLRRHVLLRRAP
ncbi:MAG: S9 family peptidase [Actinomycetota bacterium]|nr:S9 family peptidase [Actinomycetota bacterium]